MAIFDYFDLAQTARSARFNNHHQDNLYSRVQFFTESIETYRPIRGIIIGGRFKTDLKIARCAGSMVGRIEVKSSFKELELNTYKNFDIRG